MVIMGIKQYVGRMKICGDCPELTKKLTGKFCNICGCNMKLKTQIDSAKCPLGKW
jgi:hypothetical protein